MSDWFKVDKEGLRKVIAGRGKHIIIFELIQNAWDTDAKSVEISLQKLPGTPYAKLIVKDDHPEGFSDLAHAYTLFAESEKKGDPTKRGFMNLGEKLVLALCRCAEVRSTKGSVHFLEGGVMKKGRQKTDEGSVFEAEIRLNQTEFDQVVSHAWTLIPPPDCYTLFRVNDGTWKTIPGREPVATFETFLTTNISNAEGVMTRSKRKTTVEVYEPINDETPSIYEMGIPVVETGDRYHTNIMQKVPVNMNRDNVPPAFLRDLRAAVLNHTASLLSEEDSKESWVTKALESDDVESAAVNETLTKRFGEKRAIFDPSDPEANMHLTAEGFSVIHGASLPKAAWNTIRRTNAAKPSGKIRPTPRPYSSDPNAPLTPVIPRDQWSAGMKEIEKLTRHLAQKLLRREDLLVRFVRPTQKHWVAAWGGGFDWNVSALGKKYFENWHKHPHRILNTIIHEFAHDSAGNHLDENFHKACTGLGGWLAVLIAQKKVPYLKKIRGEE